MSNLPANTLTGGIGPALVPASGTVIAEKYRVEGEIGRGGAGVVLAATQLDLDVKVAIKLLGPSAGDEQVARFKREARAAARIVNEHVARTFDFGTLPSGTCFLVMEFLEGRSISAMLAERGRLEIEEAVEYVLQACDGLAAAHRLGIVHRDVKPGNMFLATVTSGAQVVKVLDFGSSKLAASSFLAENDQSMTQPTTLIGTPRYMAPEQFKYASEVDARADVYSMAASLYEMLTGVPVFVADNLATTVSRVLWEAPAAPSEKRPDIPAQLEATLLRCLAKAPDQRCATIEELAAELAPFSSTRRSPSYAAGPPAPDLAADELPITLEPLGAAPLAVVSSPHEPDPVARFGRNLPTVKVRRPTSRGALLGAGAAAALLFGLGVFVLARSREPAKDGARLLAPPPASSAVVVDAPPAPPPEETPPPTPAPPPIEAAPSTRTAARPHRPAAPTASTAALGASAPPAATGAPHPATPPTLRPPPAATGKAPDLNDFSNFGNRK